MNPVNNTAIPIKDINSVPQVFTPTPTVNPFDYAAPATQVQNDIFGGVQNAQNQVNQLTEQAKQKSSSIATLESLLGNKSQETVNLYDTTGVTNLYNQLSDLNAQATGLKNEAAAIPIQVQQQALGQGVTDRGIAPIETARLRDNALKALSLGQQYAIVSGNYDKAKNYADQLITAKYSQIEANINARKTDLATLEKYDLTPAQTKLLNAQNAAIKKQEQDLADKKAKNKAISDMLINASSQGAPSTLLERAKLAKTPAEAATILGQYSGDYWAIQKIKAEVARVNAEANKVRRETQALNTSSNNTPLNKEEVLKSLSPTAQSYVNKVIRGEATTESVLKEIGTTKDRARLRDEVNVALDKLQGGITGKKIVTQDEYQNFTNLVKNIDNIDTSAYGVIDTKGGFLSNIYDPTTNAYIDNLLGNLTLEKRQLLKGSGAISDKENQMLADSVSILSRRDINEEAATKALNNVKTILNQKIDTYNSQLGSQSKNLVDNQVDAAIRVLQSVDSSTQNLGGYQFKQP